jgi:hypothetical protein
MAHRTAQLRAQLTELNTKCLLARDNEIRFALQRSRLEAERAQLLVKLVEAAAAAPSTPPAMAAAQPYAITYEKAAMVSPPSPSPSVPATRHKPEGLPTTPAMIVAALQEAGKPARPSEIAAYIRGKWWAELPSKVIYTNAYRMFKDGRLAHVDGRYSLNRAPLNGSAAPL